MDYLMKWPEVFPTPDQTALNIAKLLVEQVISRHGVQVELLSDSGSAFLSHLMQEVCQLLGIHRVNTTAYHPQTDGLVKRFNRTLIDMLAKRLERNGRDWDTQIPYVLFAYRASLQESTGESPFFLTHGRDPRLPTELLMDQPSTRYQVDLDTYKGEVTARFKMLGRWPRLMLGKRKNGRRQPTIAKRKHQRIKSENECLSICQLQRPPKPISLPIHSMGHTTSLLFTTL